MGCHPSLSPQVFGKFQLSVTVLLSVTVTVAPAPWELAPPWWFPQVDASRAPRNKLRCAMAAMVSWSTEESLPVLI